MMTTELTVMAQSMIAGLATVLGALAVLINGRPGEKSLSFLLGIASGVMLSVVVFDLLPSSLVYGNPLLSAAGFLGGLLFMLCLDLLLSFFAARPRHRKRGALQKHFFKMGYLIGTGIALHDLPEGIAIAAGYAAADHLGLLIALAIGLHNIPEGMATAAPLLMGGLARGRIILTCLAISLFTPAGALLGLLLVAISRHVIALLLALAGGAMAYIVKNELLPEAYRRYPGYATLGFLLGVFLIPCLDCLH
ncbi:MAG TPA: ZIP family metal transporter [Peptococcaceae bacterium]|nr:ZIP family metal transporter [Peptococcaceae bacterium]HPZ70960.1 ZIP family metal transporter [Peptococcaceae bacterium]HQD54018.1 ZIP family metal transporter [Peptococcaceae bacterium]